MIGSDLYLLHLYCMSSMFCMSIILCSKSDKY